MADLLQFDAPKQPATLLEAADLLGMQPQTLRAIALRESGPLTIREAASALGVVPQTIYNLAARGELPISKVLGKSIVFRADFDAFVARARGAYRKGGR